jgi:hypothetical protein
MRDKKFYYFLSLIRRNKMRTHVKIKFLNDDNFYSFRESWKNADHLVHIEGIKNLPNNEEAYSSGLNFYLVDPENNSDFELFEDCSWAKIIWDKGEDYIEVAGEDYIHYTFFIFDSETNLVTSQRISLENNPKENEILYRQGVGKSYSQEIELFDEIGFSKFKATNGEVTSPSIKEREEFIKENTWHYYYEGDPAIESNLVYKVGVYKGEEGPAEGTLSYLYAEEISKEPYAPTKEMPIFDDLGFPLYKIINGQLLNVTKQDRDIEAARLEAELRAREAQRIVDKKNAKINEFRQICGERIVAGVDMNNSHYSYDAADQANISSLVTLALQLDMSLPYHADGESCRLFTKAEIVDLYVLQQGNVTHHTTYNNQAKLMIEGMTTDEELDAFNYGDPLTGQYLENYNSMMAAAEAATRKFIGAE